MPPDDRVPTVRVGARGSLEGRRSWGNRWRLPLLLLLGAAGYWYATRPAESSVAWQHDFNAAAAAAKSRGVPLLVDLYADWCGPCRALDGRVFASTEVAKALAEKFVAVRLDLTSTARDTPQAKAAAKYADPLTGDLALPMVLIVNPADGAVVAHASPADLDSPASMIRFLSRHAGR